jgi:hypothetical protein
MCSQANKCPICRATFTSLLQFSVIRKEPPASEQPIAEVWMAVHF